MLVNVKELCLSKMHMLMMLALQLIYNHDPRKMFSFQYLWCGVVCGQQPHAAICIQSCIWFIVTPNANIFIWPPGANVSRNCTWHLWPRVQNRISTFVEKNIRINTCTGHSVASIGSWLKYWFLVTLLVLILDNW